MLMYSASLDLESVCFGFFCALPDTVRLKSATTITITFICSYQCFSATRFELCKPVLGTL